MEMLCICVMSSGGSPGTRAMKLEKGSRSVLKPPRALKRAMYTRSTSSPSSSAVQYRFTAYGLLSPQILNTNPSYLRGSNRYDGPRQTWNPRA
jgi:hypothetical protein